MDAIWGGFDPSRREAFQRSLTVSSAGAVLLQTSISKVIQLITNRELGIQSTLPRRVGTGDKFYSNRQTAATTGAEWLDDVTEPTESEGTPTQLGFTYQTLIGRIKVTRKLIARGRTYGDVLGGALIAKTDDFVNELESASAIGDSGANANQIDGLLTLIGGISGQTIANTSSNGGDDLYITKLDQTIQQVKGYSNAAAMRIYVSKTGQRKVNSALEAQQRFNDMTVIDAGFVVKTYNGIPIIVSTGIPDTMVFNAAAPKVTRFTTGSTTALIVVNTTYVFYGELTPWTVMPLAKTSSQFDQVDMFLDIALVLDNPLGGAILGGISL